MMINEEKIKGFQPELIEYGRNNEIFKNKIFKIL